MLKVTLKRPTRRTLLIGIVALLLVAGILAALIWWLNRPEETITATSSAGQVIGDANKAIIDGKSIDEVIPNLERYLAVADSDFEKSKTAQTLGSMYGMKLDHQKALEYYKKAVEFSKSAEGNDDPFAVDPNLYYQMGLTAQLLKDKKQALNYFELAIAIYQQRVGTQPQLSAIVAELEKRIKEVKT